MARDIDELIEHVRDNCDWLPPVFKQIVINRLNLVPSQYEIDEAHEQLYGPSDTAWKERGDGE